MKKQKKQNRYQEKVDWDDMTIGELSHHIGKKMTEKVVKSKKQYTRKTKHKNKGDKLSWLERFACTEEVIGSPPISSTNRPVRLVVRT